MLKPWGEGGGGGGVNLVIWKCVIILGTFLGYFRIFGYLFGLFLDFWVSFFCEICVYLE